MATSAETYTAEEQTQYQFVDTIPEVAAAREDKRLYAESILQRRRDNLINGIEPAGDLPLPIDALSTARKVHETAKLFGDDSPEYQERHAGLVLDCNRLVAEWWRKKKPEYFPPKRHFFDETVQEFFSHGRSLRQMTENGLSPLIDDPEEEARRVNEHVEDATPQILRGLGKIAIDSQVSIRTISECTDRAIDSYEEDLSLGNEHQGYGGYVPEIKKIMVRDIRLDDKTKDRFEEQIAIPGIYITHAIIKLALERRSAPAEMDKTKLHGSQILAGDGLLDFAALLDEVASEEWCTEIFMGEEVPKDFTKNYEAFKAEALGRQEQQGDIAQSVASYVLDLAEDETVDGSKAPGMVEDFVKCLLLHEAKGNLSVAEQMFDESTALGLQEVNYLESIGRYEEANNRMIEVQKNAPGGGYCGAGSCGLESVAKLSETADKGHKLGLKGDLIHDKVRTCPSCHKNKILYDKAANKACTACGLKRLNGKTSKSDNTWNKPKQNPSRQQEVAKLALQNTSEKPSNLSPSKSPVGV